MRKSIITQGSHDAKPSGMDWLNLEERARAELTSEDPARPIESALKQGGGPGWRASEPGRQTIRLLFDQPLRVRRIHLLFREDEQTRTQEFVLRWTSDSGDGGNERAYRDIVRQQYTFSPPDNASEIEEYDVDLVGLTGLELTVSPEISGGSARASLAELRLA